MVKQKKKKKTRKTTRHFFAVIKKKIIPNEENLASFNEELLINYVTLLLYLNSHLNWLTYILNLIDYRSCVLFFFLFFI